ncbi:hypothetical protein B6U90_02845 [Thermoplasmatales archaeon ex4484_6]|nr:MAG: hypothetical protein B6U90_02845 [Thermoplasmatales archaeon ex4484_6]
MTGAADTPFERKRAASGKARNDGGGSNGPISEREHHSGRSPTKDYRSFKGTYRGRSYRIYRMIVTNLGQTLRSPWSKGIIILSYIFVFFHLLSIVFGATEVSLKDEYGALDPDVLFTVEPVVGQDARILVVPGETYSVSYIVSNTGNDADELETMVMLPSPLWEEEHYIQGKRVLGTGDSAIVHVNITVPERGFSIVSEGDVFSSISGQRGAAYYDREMGGPKGGGVRPEPVEGIDQASNSMYIHNTSRLVGIVCFPGSLKEDISAGGTELYDVRIRSCGTVFMLDPGNETVRREMGIPATYFLPSFGIRVEEDAPGPYGISAEAPESFTLILHLFNDGDSTVELVLDVLQFPVADPSAYMEFMYPGDSGPGVSLEPGEEIDITMVISTGYMPYRVGYSLMVTATDISDSYFHVTEARHVTLSITGSSDEEEKPGERYHQILWGGGFFYERYLWLILLSAFAGAGIVGRDIEENSIALYLSRPVTMFDYLLSKASALFITLSTITIVPAIVLFLAGMSFSTRDIRYIIEHSYILGAMILSYIIALTVFTSVSMAFSSMVRKWILAGVGIFVLFIFSSTISDILFAIFGRDHLKLLNMNYVMKKLFEPLFGLGYDSSGTGIEWYWMALVLAGLVVISWSLILVRFRKGVVK